LRRTADGRRRAEKRDTTGEITIPPGPKLGGLVVGRGVPVAGDRLLIDDLNFKLRRAASSGSSEQTARENHPLPDDHRPGEARRGRVCIGDAVKLAYVDQADALAGEKTVFQVSAGWTSSTWAAASCLAGLPRRVQLQGGDQRSG
jgi:hypothetical protein